MSELANDSPDFAAMVKESEEMYTKISNGEMSLEDVYKLDGAAI